MSTTETRPAVDDRPRFDGAWERKRLGDYCQASSGGTPDSKTAAFYGSEIPWASVSDITTQGRFLRSTERHLSQLGLARSTAQLWPHGTILYAMYASPGECSISTIEVSSSQAILGIQCGASVDRDFLYYRLASSKRDILGSIQHGTQANLNKGIVLGLEFSLPPLPEQRAIAAALSDVDDLLQSLDRLIAKKRDVKQGAMQQLLTGTTRLPGFEGAWEPVSLFDSAGRSRAQFDDGDWVESKDLSDSGVRLIQTGNVGVGRFRENDRKRWISDETFDRLRCHEVHCGDLLICRLADPAGRACIAPDCGDTRMITSVDVTIFRPSEEIADARFLVQYFCTPDWLREVADSCGGTTRTRISKSNLGRLTVTLPPLPEQHAIAAVLSDMDAEIDALEARRDKAAAIKQGMMQELLTGRTRLPIPQEDIA